MRRLVTKNLLLASFLFALVVHFAATSHAQDLASITGAVSDTSGAVIPNASVILANESTNVSYSAVTNSLGSYSISNVAPGPGYKITFSAQHFKTVIITGIYLNVNTTRTQNAKLSVGAESQTVQVSAASENVTLNTTDATLGNNFQVQELNDLPVEDRGNPSALFYQQPGVTLDGNVTGARSDQSNVTLDGLEVNDNATGEFGVIVGNAPVDSVQEFRGVTGDPLSSAGQGGGGQFELVTKGGTNDFHGNINEYHRDTDLEANDWFNNNSGVGRPPLVRNQFGGNIGGPIWRNKAFFFFDYDGRRDAVNAPVDRTVPLGGVAGQSGCAGSTGYREGYVCYVNSSGAIVALSPSDVATLDPQGTGWDQTELTLFQQRFPVANDLTGDVGDLVNTAGFRFNAPTPVMINNYVQRVDFNLNDKMKIFGRGTFTQRNDQYGTIQFPGDPTTYPRYDRSYAWVVGHTWTITQNILNQAEYGETFEDLEFPVTYNPQGDNVFSYAGVSGPYPAGNNAQARTYPIPVLRDDFSWQKGRHSFTFGGTFKWENPKSFQAENYNFQDVGVTGNTYFNALSDNLRPSDIQSSEYATSIYDSAFSTALGAYAETFTNFNYNNKGVVEAYGAGLNENFRYYETELYVGDSWKATPDLTITYGVRYQNYTPPYETHGLQASAQLNENGTVTPFSFNSYWNDRVKQAAAGNSTATAVPFVQYVLGGNANNGAPVYQPQNKLFAPHFAFAWTPTADKKSVISGGASIVYDHRVVNALQFIQTQLSYLFEASNENLYGISGDPTDSLASSDPTVGGLPRFSGINTPPAPPATPNVTPPYTPYVADTPGGPFPYGGEYGEGNVLIDPNLKNPYNIEFGLNFQRELPQGYLLKLSYMGRLGRRLLAEADASQLIDFPDNTGGSNQTMAQGESGMVTQMRQYASLGAYGAASSLSPQPWFEDELPGLAAELNTYYDGNYFANNTQAAAYAAYPYSARGDFADTMWDLLGALPPNIGLDAQFAADTIWTNKGFSDYNAMLVTLHKNVGYGLQFDLNYTWAHSIDNVSAIANFIAENSGFGFICDVSRPRECRGNSDFDVANYLNGTFIYELPFGRTRTIGTSMPVWADELAGGWEISGIPAWHTGEAYTINSNAYVAGFANNAPATLIASPAILKTKIHGGEGNPLNAYANPAQALAAFTGPTGFNIGSRNNLFGPGFFNLDLSLGKTFPIDENRVSLKFRCDAFNAFNHPNFNPPSGSGADITEAAGVPLGTISSTYVPPDSDISARVLQLSLRLEF
ncbi:MAG: TonB-dependent receptor [Terracidiphilus sp.]